MSAVLIESIETGAAAPRHNIYRAIHKALRAFMADTLLKLGRMDADDDGERAEALAQLRGLLAMCAGHLHHEDEFVHAALEQARAGSSAATAGDHRHHERSLAALEREIVRFEAAPAGGRAEHAQGLYLEVSRFVAENFTHMIVEEVDNHAELVAAYNEGDVRALEARLVAALPQEMKLTAMRWMIPHLNAAERAAMLGGMKRHAPREVFEGVLALARSSLSQRDFYKLERALG